MQGWRDWRQRSEEGEPFDLWQKWMLKRRDRELQRRLQTRHALNSQQSHQRERKIEKEGKTEGERKVEQIERDRKERARENGRVAERQRRKEEKTERMKMKLRETDKTRMLKGFQSVGCLGSSLQPYAKAISIEPLLGKSSQTTAAISNIVRVKQPSQANPTVPIKPQVLIAVSGWCRISQPISVYSQKSWPSESLFNWKPRDSKQCCFAGLKRPAQHDNKSSTLKVKGILRKSCRQRGDREKRAVCFFVAVQLI